MNGELQAAIEARIMGGTTFMGVPALKNPMDAWVYQEIIWEQRPDFIVEVGNKHGGSLLYLAAICDLVGQGRVVGVDLNREHLDPSVLTHMRIIPVVGSAQEAFPLVVSIVGDKTCLVIEDSAHTFENTLAVLHSYGTLVKPGGYMICEDGVMAPVAEALEQFRMEQDDFVADRSREWPVTWNPGGYLRRVQP